MSVNDTAFIIQITEEDPIMAAYPLVSRKHLVQMTLKTVPGLFLAGTAAALLNCKGRETMEEEVSPLEDLMREHGLLKRVMLCYDEILARLDKKRNIPPGTLADSASIIRNFIENYHEKLEEDHLFPRFKKAGKLADLVDVLISQHKGGRTLTGIIVDNSDERALGDATGRAKVMDALRRFNRMYGPHQAREDTVLFPAFHLVVTPKEYKALGAEFEDKEHELFGKEGFEGMVDRVAGIENKLGIGDLSKFTPRQVNDV
jgi:hemerythrin-like domain-containing protein